MGLKEWLTNFRGLHESARAGKLSRTDRALYTASRDELARALLKSQNMAIAKHFLPREALRVAVALPIKVELGLRTMSGMIQDLSAGGFSALVGELVPQGSAIRFSLSLGRGLEPVEGKAKVVSSTVVRNSPRLGAQFAGLVPSEREQVEFAVFDAVLSKLEAGAPVE